MFEDLVKGLLLLVEKGMMTRALADVVITQVIKRHYYGEIELRK